MLRYIYCLLVDFRRKKITILFPWSWHCCWGYFIPFLNSFNSSLNHSRTSVVRDTFTKDYFRIQWISCLKNRLMKHFPICRKCAENIWQMWLTISTIDFHFIYNYIKFFKLLLTNFPGLNFNSSRFFKINLFPKSAIVDDSNSLLTSITCLIIFFHFIWKVLITESLTKKIIICRRSYVFVFSDIFRWIFVYQ